MNGKLNRVLELLLCAWAMAELTLYVLKLFGGQR
jgi:hypothetical protein